MAAAVLVCHDESREGEDGRNRGEEPLHDDAGVYVERHICMPLSSPRLPTAPSLPTNGVALLVLWAQSHYN